MPVSVPSVPADIGFEFSAMATSCQVRVAGLAEALARQLAERAIAEVRRIETKYSRYRGDSVVSHINHAAGTGELIEVDAETAGLLNFAAQLHHLSDGLFDITSGTLRRVWDFKAAKLPEQNALDAALARVGWQHVQWDGQRISLSLPNMEIDFGGLGKEYAVDRAATLLEEAQVRSGLVSLGGDLRLLGPQPDGCPWSIGISHPRQPGAVIASLALSRGALATSGDYERGFDLGGRRYCHILNPHTGWPVNTWQSVSVVAPVCLAAGAMSTIAMLKEDSAHSFLREQGVGFLTVDRNGRIEHAVV